MLYEACNLEFAVRFSLCLFYKRLCCATFREQIVVHIRQKLGASVSEPKEEPQAVREQHEQCAVGLWAIYFRHNFLLLT